MKRPPNKLGPFFVMLCALSCGGRTDLSEFLTLEDDGPVNGAGGALSPAGGKSGVGGTPSSGGSTLNLPPSGGAPSDTRCPEGEFDADTLLGELTCRPWSECGPGEYVTMAPTSGTDRQCGACPEGTFSTRDNQAACDAWTKCSFGAIVSRQGTKSSDVECEEPDTFAAVPFGERLDAAGMTATTQGIYLGLNLASGPLPIVLKASLDGTTMLPFQVPNDDGGIVTDVTSLGTDIYVATLNGVVNGLENRTARIVKFDADGQELSVLDLDKAWDEWLLNVLLTSDGTDVIVARQVLPVDCNSGSDCAPGVESHLVLSRFDQSLTLVSEIRHYAYFNFAAIGDLEVAAGRVFLSGELTGNSGIHAFLADGSVLHKYDDFEVGGSIGYVLAPNSDGSVFSVMSDTGPLGSNLARVDGTLAQLLGPVPQSETDSVLGLVATERELFLLAHRQGKDSNVFTVLDHQGQLIEHRVEEKDFTYLSEMVQAPNGELFVGGTGDDGEQQVAIIRPWQR